MVPGVFCTILDDITCQPNPILEGHPAAGDWDADIHALSCCCFTERTHRGGQRNF
uniref:KAT8 regulatory NSL complex subunit 3-like n=1 Tax=Ictidomys tridecemlineatus TaxID=43179 RepID=A0A287D0V1_ICTTR